MSKQETKTANLAFWILELILLIAAIIFISLTVSAAKAADWGMFTLWLIVSLLSGLGFFAAMGLKGKKSGFIADMFS